MGRKGIPQERSCDVKSKYNGIVDPLRFPRCQELLQGRAQKNGPVRILVRAQAIEAHRRGRT
jgi:hypothetical protein